VIRDKKAGISRFFYGGLFFDCAGVPDFWFFSLWGESSDGVAPAVY
jgi:hypothetical protein